MQCVTIDTNVFNRASSQYTGFNFNSMMEFNGKFLGVNSDGLHEIGKNGEEVVNSEFEFVKTDLGIQNVKKFRKFYLGLCCDGDMELDHITDDNDPKTKKIPSVGKGVHRVRVTTGRKTKGRFWSWRMRNVAGCDFSLYSIEGLPVVLHSGRT